MPKLLAFLPCLKAIDWDDGLLTVVSILEYVGVTLPANQPTPEPNAAVPLQWQMVSIWHGQPDDAGKQFEQVIEFILPSGQSVFSNTSPIELTSARTRIRIDGKLFPVGVAGEVTIRVGCREVGQNDIHPQSEYPVLVQHNAPGNRVDDSVQTQRG